MENPMTKVAIYHSLLRIEIQVIFLTSQYTHFYLTLEAKNKLSNHTNKKINLSLFEKLKLNNFARN